MLTQMVLIIDPRTELPMKYKKIIEHNSELTVEIAKGLKAAIDQNGRIEPDLILISDSIDEDIQDVCRLIRTTTKANRPVVVVMSKSSHIDDKVAVLNSGADDFLSEPIDQNEFTARIFAHLRRQLEDLSDPVTKLPMVNTTYKAVRRALKTKQEWALLYVDIDHFDSYSQVYGDLASNKMLEAFTAILQSAIDNDDFLGQINSDDFMLVTSKYKAEKISSFLSYAFGSVAQKFYTEEDIKRGYLIVHGDRQAGKRISLVSTSVGVVTNEHRNFQTFKEAINAVIDVHKLAKIQPGSSCVTDRLQLCGCSSVVEAPSKKILIVENDAALAYLLTTTLEMQNYQSEAISNYDEVAEKIESYNPDIVLIDAGNESSLHGLDVCRSIKENLEFAKVKVIVSTVIHDKEMILNSGADLYLPKPYELTTLFSWVDKFFGV